MSDSTFDLSGRLAVITGASSGIGAAMAGFLAEAGADVAIVARRADALERTADTCRSHGVVAHAVVGDVGSPEAAQAVAGEVRAYAGEPVADPLQSGLDALHAPAWNLVDKEKGY